MSVLILLDIIDITEITDLLRRILWESQEKEIQLMINNPFIQQGITGNSNSFLLTASISIVRYPYSECYMRIKCSEHTHRERLVVSLLTNSL